MSRVATPAAPAVVGTLATGAPVVVAPGVEMPAPVKAAPKAPNAPVQAMAAATLDGVRVALREVFNARGATAATELLKQFGAARVGEVKPEDYAKFVAACGK